MLAVSTVHLVLTMLDREKLPALSTIDAGRYLEY
jgi:hypothetical protein